MAHPLPSAGTALNLSSELGRERGSSASCLFVVHVRALQLLIDGG